MNDEQEMMMSKVRCPHTLHRELGGVDKCCLFIGQTLQYTSTFIESIIWSSFYFSHVVS